MAAIKIPRRHAIPILYTRGTHYDVGFDTGRTFAAIIRNFLQLYEPLNSSYLPLYETEEGKRVYKETLESVRKSFPQYVRELEGVADGAQVEFHKLFLIHMDEILPVSLERENTVNGKQPVGCSSIMVNKTQCQILAHTEDALSETLNHFYFVDAHIISECPQGKYKVKEEHFLSLCYAGSLPGYTMSYNHHGFAFTINTISASELRSGKTPRVFLTRALLAAENWDQAKTIITDAGVGAADACSINMVFLKNDKPDFYNVEIGPALGEDTESQVNIKEVPEGEENYHCNRYQRLKSPENNELMIASSDSRTKTFNSYKLPKTKEEVLEMLGDTSELPHPVFRDSEDLDEIVKTIAVGMFDFQKKTYSIYASNPKTDEPLVVLPLHLKE